MVRRRAAGRMTLRGRAQRAGRSSAFSSLPLAAPAAAHRKRRSREVRPSITPQRDHRRAGRRRAGDQQVPTEDELSESRASCYRWSKLRARPAPRTETRMRVWPSLLLATLLAAGCERSVPTPAASATSSAPSVSAAADEVARESARLNDWFNARFEEELDFSPLTKTQLGRKDDYDRIDDMSEAAGEARRAWLRDSVAELEREFDRSRLSPEAQISYDLWRYRFDLGEAAYPFRRRGYVFHQMSGPHTGLPQALINFHRVDEEADMVAYVTRLGELGRALEQALEHAQVSASEGVHAPRFAYDAVVQQSRAIITGAPFEGPGDSPLFADAKAKLAGLVDGGKIDAA